MIIMRKKLLFISIASLIAVLGICLYGCERMHTPDDSKLQNESETEADTEAIDEKVDYTAKYSDVLAEMYYLIIDVEANENLDDGFVGVLEAARALGDAALEEIGYLLYDINGDDIPELLIGCFNKADGAYTNNEIYAIYTLIDDAEHLILEGYSRSAYSIKEDNSLFYQGSAGAAYSIFGTFHISENGTVVCDDYYFTYPDDNDFNVTIIFHNNSGIFSRDESEKLDMTLDEFWHLHEKSAKETSKLLATPFAELDDMIIENEPEINQSPAQE